MIPIFYICITVSFVPLAHFPHKPCVLFFFLHCGVNNTVIDNLEIVSCITNQNQTMARDG